MMNRSDPASPKYLLLELGTLAAYWLASDYLPPRDVALLTLLLCVGSAVMTVRAGRRLDGLWVFGNATALVMSFQEWLRPNWPGGAMNDVLIGAMLLWCGFQVRGMVATMAQAQRERGVFLNEALAARLMRRLAFVWSGYFLTLAIVDLVLRTYVGVAKAETWSGWIFGASAAILAWLSVSGLRRARMTARTRV